jgi:hypothetical protein
MTVNKLIEELEHFRNMGRGDLEIHAEDDHGAIEIDQVITVFESVTLEHKYLMLSPSGYEG